MVLDVFGDLFLHGFKVEVAGHAHGFALEVFVHKDFRHYLLGMSCHISLLFHDFTAP